MRFTVDKSATNLPHYLNLPDVICIFNLLSILIEVYFKFLQFRGIFQNYVLHMRHRE